MKSGIDYFPLDVSLDSKISLIEAEYGVTGFGVVVHLLQEIYGQEGYYIEWTDEVALLFARKYGLGGNVVSEIVGASIKRGMFNKEIFEKYHVLTSKGIQKRYFEAVSRRKVFEVDYNILLVNVDQILKNADIKRKNVNILSENADISKQSKVEESKVEQSKETIAAEPRSTRFIPPTVEEVRAYCEERKNGINPQLFIDHYAAAHWMRGNTKIEDWKACVRTWEGRGKNGKPVSGNAPKSAGGSKEKWGIHYDNE